MLGLWLERLPDGTYPNTYLCSEMLKLIGTLNIDADNLHRSKNLLPVFRDYAAGCTGNLHLQSTAKQIVDKWDRTLQNITTSYNEEDENEQYRKFKSHIK